VGLADSWLSRALGTVPFVWTVPGAQCAFRGRVQFRHPAETFVAEATLFGYRDRNFGQAYTPSWRWAAAPSLLPFPYSTDYDALPLSEMLRVAENMTRALTPSPGKALVIGGQAPEIFRKHRHSIILLWMKGKRHVFDGFELGSDWGFQDLNVHAGSDELFMSLHLRRRGVSLACGFAVPISSTVSYPIVDGDFRSVYNDQTGNRLWQSGVTTCSHVQACVGFIFARGRAARNITCTLMVGRVTTFDACAILLLRT